MFSAQKFEVFFEHFSFGFQWLTGLDYRQISTTNRFFHFGAMQVLKCVWRCFAETPRARRKHLLYIAIGVAAKSAQTCTVFTVAIPSQLQTFSKSKLRSLQIPERISHFDFSQHSLASVHLKFGLAHNVATCFGFCVVVWSWAHNGCQKTAQ